MILGLVMPLQHMEPVLSVVEFKPKLAVLSHELTVPCLVPFQLCSEAPGKVLVLPLLPELRRRGLEFVPLPATVFEREQEGDPEDLEERGIAQPGRPASTGEGKVKFATSATRVSLPPL